MNKIKTVLATLALLSAVLLGVSACGTPVASSTPAKSTQAVPSYTPAPAPAYTPPPTPTPSPSDSITKFGSTLTWTDKLAVSVKPVGPGQVTASGMGAEKSAGALYMFDVTVTNGTAALYDPSLMNLSVVYGADGAQAAEVFDTAQGLGSPFSGKIIPGKAQTVRMGFAIPATGLSDVTVTLTPDYSHNDAIFTGALQ